MVACLVSVVLGGCVYLFITNKETLIRSNQVSHEVTSIRNRDIYNDIKIELIDPVGKLLKYRVSSQIMQKYGNIIPIGRGERAFVRIANKSVSNLHCTLIVTNGELNIRDENSTNGTYVDGVKLTPNVPMRISKRNRVKIGELTGYIFLL